MKVTRLVFDDVGILYGVPFVHVARTNCTISVWTVPLVKLVLLKVEVTTCTRYYVYLNFSAENRASKNWIVNPE